MRVWVNGKKMGTENRARMWPAEPQPIWRWDSVTQPCHSRGEPVYSGTLCAPAMLDGIEEAGTEDSGPSFSGTYAMAHQTPTVVIRGAICLPYGTSGPAICKPLPAPFLLPWAVDRSCARRRRRRLRSPDTVAPAGPLFRGLAARSRASWSQTTVRRTKHPHAALHKRLVRREERLL